MSITFVQVYIGVISYFLFVLLQILQVFDSCAGELGPDQFNTFALPYLKDIAYRTRELLIEAHVEPVPMVGITWS